MEKTKKEVKEKRHYVVCPECNTEIEIEDFYSRGDIIVCEECGEEYVIRSLRPIKIMPLERDDLDYEEKEENNEY
jgi:lysine biosynthesis protein LysW